MSSQNIFSVILRKNQISFVSHSKFENETPCEISLTIIIDEKGPKSSISKAL